MTHTTDIHVPRNSTKDIELFFTGRHAISVASQTLRVWYERSQQRKRLARLDDRLLRDIGIDRQTARNEASKPFWKA